jgi:hypothetical protein
MKGARDRFFRRVPGGRFVDATAAAGLEDRAVAFGFAVRAGDYDGDGDQDLYVANDSDANYLFRNEGGGRFREMALFAGAAYNANGSAQASMGVSAGDIDGDALLDIFVTNFAEDHCTLYRGLPGGIFVDETSSLGLQQTTWMQLSWGCVLADLDSDGDLDLAIAGGHIYPQVDAHPEVGHTYIQKPLLLENRRGRFFDASANGGPGFDVPICGRGLAAGDYDNDGDLDLVITRLDASPVLLRNDGPQGAWLIVAFEDARGVIPVPGASVQVTAGGRTQRRDAAVGDSYLSTHDPRLHFGLGEATKAEEVRVRWPDGTVTVELDVPARRILRVRKGG